MEISAVNSVLILGVISDINFETEEDFITEDQDTPDQARTGEGVKSKPDNPFAEDKIEFLDISADLKEEKNIAGCPFVSIKDSNGTKIMYDAAVHDFFDMVNDLGLLLAFYLENDVAYYQDDQFEDLDLQFEDNLYDNILTQKNINVKISKFNYHFNYEYLVTRLLEFECQFQAEKSKFCNEIFRLTKQVSDSSSIMELFDYLTDMLSRRPHLDLTKYAYCNQNNAEWLQRVNLPREKNTPDRGEILNLVTSFFDNYKLEIEYFKDLNCILNEIIGQQTEASLRVDTILKTFEAYQGIKRPEEHLPEQKPVISGDYICQILKQIDNIGSTVYSSFLSPCYLDKNTFSSFIFDTHYKQQVEEYLELPSANACDFSSVLNDFMNGTASRYRFFVEQSARKLAVAEIKQLITSVREGVPVGDDITAFEGDFMPVPDHCFSALSTTFSFFKTQASSSQLQGFDEQQNINVVDKESFMQQMNRYFSYTANFSMNFSIRQNLIAASYAAQLYKTQVSLVKPVLESLTKQGRFEKPEDMINSEGNLLMQFIDFGDSWAISVEDINMVDYSYSRL